MMNYGELENRPTVVLTKDLIKKFMPAYKRYDDLIIVQEQAWEDFKKALPLPVAHEENSPFSVDEDELASLVCQACPESSCKRLAVERNITKQDLGAKSSPLARPHTRLILGDTGAVLRRRWSF